MREAVTLWVVMFSHMKLFQSGQFSRVILWYEWMGGDSL